MEKRDQPLGLVMPGGQQTLREQTLGKESPAAIPDAWIVIIMPPPPSLPVRWLSLTAAPEVLRDRQKLPARFACFTTLISRFSR
jgi:hypothetical protein